MCSAEIEPGEDAVSKGRIVCRACAGVVEDAPEPAEEVEETED